MTFQIKNTINGKIIRDAITRKPRCFDSWEDARQFQTSYAANCRIDCKRPFRLVIVKAEI
jgi:hypothetical protein